MTADWSGCPMLANLTTQLTNLQQAQGMLALALLPLIVDALVYLGAGCLGHFDGVRSAHSLTVCNRASSSGGSFRLW
jgi:hypothetical protein